MYYLENVDNGIRRLKFVNVNFISLFFERKRIFHKKFFKKQRCPYAILYPMMFVGYNIAYDNFESRRPLKLSNWIRYICCLFVMLALFCGTKHYLTVLWNAKTLVVDFSCEDTKTPRRQFLARKARRFRKAVFGHEGTKISEGSFWPRRHFKRDSDPNNWKWFGFV